MILFVIYLCIINLKQYVHKNKHLNLLFIKRKLSKLFKNVSNKTNNLKNISLKKIGISFILHIMIGGLSLSIKGAAMAINIKFLDNNNNL